ncbi:hypothetical protein SAMN05216464_101872 [Mucilaginibacter pineti]|uniref:Uncharacterized protein n=1 Tax=Mucilaginibacter pineti TaxID=1391627 RepID=A0A1G6V5X6_9SPHI|nr:hypothetical protein [Mucilaginibacter pineti]SDD48938.1 hypothetical protein SAMN05216464_101872 [Mucilaginibacter pineti]
MKNPVTLALKHADGSKRMIIIEPVLLHNLTDAGVYKIYKTSIDNESELFTEDLEIDEGHPAMADTDNPDYLGTITFKAGHQQWDYNGELLNTDEQQQIATYLLNK